MLICFQSACAVLAALFLFPHLKRNKKLSLFKSSGMAGLHMQEEQTERQKGFDSHRLAKEILI